MTHSTVSRWLFAGLGTIFLAGSLTGCGSSENKPRRVAFEATGVADPSLMSETPAPAQAPPQSPQTPPADAAAQAPANPQPGEGPPPGENAPPGGEAANPAGNSEQPGGAPATPPKPPEIEKKRERSKDVAAWNKRDYVEARAQGDPLLIQAMASLAQRYPRDPRVATKLAELLPPPKIEEDPQKKGQANYQPPQPPQKDPKLAETIVTILADNGTADARKVLEQILAGTITSDDDKVAVDTTLKVLAEHRSPENEALLFRALTDAEGLRQQAAGEIKAEDLRQKTLAVIQPIASDQFRTKLAEHLSAPNIPPQRREALGKFLEEDRLENVGAQLIMYQSEQTAKEKKATLEEYFTDYSSEALGRMLGLVKEESGDAAGDAATATPAPAPAGTMPTSTAAVAPAPPDPDLLYRTAQRLWSGPSAAMIEKRLGEVDSLEKQAQAILLAATVPVESTRMLLWRRLNRRWDDGPKPLETAGLPAQLLTDPGLVLIVKGLPRLEAKDTTSVGGTGVQPTTRSTSTRTNRYRVTTPTPTATTTGKASPSTKKTPEQQLQAKQDWMKMSGDLARNWCERLGTAAAASGQTAKLTGAAEADDEPAACGPVTLHAGAKVAARYDIQWPGAGAAKLSGVAVGPMEIHYARIEGTHRPQALVGYYRRQLQLGEKDLHTIEKGVWLDVFRPVAQTDRKRSIDVLITRTGDPPAQDPQSTQPQGAAPAFAASKVEEDLVVQILSIEVKDPTGGEK